ncbi:hypothetical protein DYB34_008215 [Aphanomyces astaci]|uniref:Nucleoporin Nup88 n=1 Tax=Aphanomyces astaci TaxID=112090 RepID=A0A418CFT9_APHAT|nr:hypothetical protein DYB34_008215 [Aphanomyces astaci]
MHRPGTKPRVMKKATSNAFKLNTSTASSAPSASPGSSSTSDARSSNATSKPAASGSSATDSFLSALATASTVAAATLANVLPDVHVNLFCLCETSGDLVFVGAKGRLCHINIHASKPSLHDLTPRKSSDNANVHVLSSASHLAFNPRGTKVLVQTNEGALYVFNLPLSAHHRLTPTPQLVQVVFADGSRRVVKLDDVPSPDTTSVQRALATLSPSDRAKVKTVVPDVFEVDLRRLLLLPTVTAVSATWHPLSDSHVVLLTSTDDLLVYATDDSTFSPEQTHPLSFAPPSSSVGASATTSLSFGPVTGWEALTVYILRSNGDLFALSPILPHDGASVPASLLRFLHQATDGQLTLANVDLDTRIHVKAQKHWLATVWPADLPPPSVDEDEDITSPLSAPTNAWTRSSTSADAIATLHWPVQLQGPFPYGSATWSHPNSKAHSVAAVAYPGASPNNLGRAPVLAIGWSSGHPRWQLKKPKPQQSSRSPPPPSVYLVECINIGATCDNGKLHLATHPLNAQVVYALHSTGVHVLHLPYVTAPLAPPPFTASVHRVLSLAPSATALVTGAAVIYSVERGHVLVVLYASGQWELVNVSAKTASCCSSSSNVRAPAPSSSFAATTPVVTPLAQLVDELQDKFVSHKIHVQGGSTSLPDTTIDTFHFAQNHIPALLDQAAYVEAIGAATRSRIELHREWKDQQTTDAATLDAALGASASAFADLLTRVQALQAKQSQLNDRAAAVLQAVKENQTVLSKAEIQYKQELHEMAHAARRLVPKVTQVKLDAQKLLRNALVDISPPTTASSLSPDRARICHDVLTAEAQLIADTTARLHELTSLVASSLHL